MEDDELTRDDLATVGKLELEYFKTEYEVLDSGASFIELQDLFAEKAESGGEILLDTEQANLVFLAVHFASVFRTLHRMNQSVTNYFGE